MKVIVASIGALNDKIIVLECSDLTNSIDAAASAAGLLGSTNRRKKPPPGRLRDTGGETLSRAAAQ